MKTFLFVAVVSKVDQASLPTGISAFQEALQKHRALSKTLPPFLVSRLSFETSQVMSMILNDIND